MRQRRGHDSLYVQQTKRGVLFLDYRCVERQQANTRRIKG